MHRGVILVSVAVLCIGCGLGLCWFWHTHFVSQVGYTPVPFTSEAWAAADPETRGHVANDLLARYQLKGMGSKEVEELLGPAPYRLGYMGFNPHFPIVFSYELHIEFDAAGKVERAFIDD
jgi:hypothetical protein